MFCVSRPLTPLVAIFMAWTLQSTDDDTVERQQEAVRTQKNLRLLTVSIDWRGEGKQGGNESCRVRKSCLSLPSLTPSFFSDSDVRGEDRELRKWSREVKQRVQVTVCSFLSSSPAAFLLDIESRRRMRKDKSEEEEEQLKQRKPNSRRERNRIQLKEKQKKRDGRKPRYAGAAKGQTCTQTEQKRQERHPCQSKLILDPLLASLECRYIGTRR